MKEPNVRFLIFMEYFKEYWLAVLAALFLVVGLVAILIGILIEKDIMAIADIGGDIVVLVGVGAIFIACVVFVIWTETVANKYLH